MDNFSTGKFCQKTPHSAYKLLKRVAKRGPEPPDSLCDDALLQVGEDVQGVALRLPEVQLPSLEDQHLHLADGGMEVCEVLPRLPAPDGDGDCVRGRHSCEKCGRPGLAVTGWSPKLREVSPSGHMPGSHPKIVENDRATS